MDGYRHFRGLWDSFVKGRNMDTCMDDDASRRDVMRALAGAMAVSDVPDVDLVNVEQSKALPEISESEPFWVVLYAASNVDPDRIDERLFPLLDVLCPTEMDGGVARNHVRVAARGEYDAEMLERRAAQAWAVHTPSLE